MWWVPRKNSKLGPDSTDLRSDLTVEGGLCFAIRWSVVSGFGTALSNPRPYTEQP